MKQTSKLAALALVGNISAKKLLADNIYLQFLDNSLFDDEAGNPTISGPQNDTIYMNDNESVAARQRVQEMMAQ